MPQQDFTERELYRVRDDLMEMAFDSPSEMKQAMALLSTAGRPFAQGREENILIALWDDCFEVRRAGVEYKKHPLTSFPQPHIDVRPFAVAYYGRR